MIVAQLSGAQQVGARIAQERRLKAAREARDIDQRDIAKAIGVTPGAVSRWESGVTVPKDAAILALAKYFGVTPAWLHYGQEPREAPHAALIPDTRKKKKPNARAAGD